VEGTGSEFCSTAFLGISGVEPSGSTTKVR
jgi:hypothetical protein